MPYPYDDDTLDVFDPNGFPVPDMRPTTGPLAPRAPYRDMALGDSSGGDFTPDVPNLLSERAHLSRWQNALAAMGDMPAPRVTPDEPAWGALAGGFAAGLMRGAGRRAQRVEAQQLQDIRDKNAVERGRSEVANRAKLMKYGAGLKPQGQTVTMTDDQGNTYTVPQGSTLGQRFIGQKTGVTPAPVQTPTVTETDPTTGKPITVSANSGVGQKILGKRLGLAPKPKGTPAPKPPKVQRLNQQSWRILPEDNKAAVEGFQKQIDALRNDPIRARALEPPPVDTKGVPRKEPGIVTTARGQVSGLRKQIDSAYRNAYVWHLGNLPQDPQDAEFVWHQIANDAESRHLVRMGANGYTGDPEISKLLNDGADRIEKLRGQ